MEEENWGELAKAAEAKAEAFEKEQAEKSPPAVIPEDAPAGDEKEKTDKEPPKRRRVVEAKKPEAPAENPEVEAEKREWLKQAEKYGFKVDEGTVTNRDKAELRLAKKSINDEVNRRGAEIERLYSQKLNELQDDIQAANFFRSAIENQDFDSLAKAAGFKSFAEMSMAHVKRGTDPALSEVQKLRRELEMRDRKEAELRQRNEEEMRARQETKAQEEYFISLRDELSSNADPLIAGFASDEADGASFTAAVLEVQKKHWDGYSTISPEEAAKIVVGQIRDSYARTASRLGNRPQTETVTASPGARRTTSRTISQDETSQPSRMGNSEDDDIQSWARKWQGKVSF